MPDVSLLLFRWVRIVVKCAGRGMNAVEPVNQSNNTPFDSSSSGPRFVTELNRAG